MPKNVFEAKKPNYEFLMVVDSRLRQLNMDLKHWAKTETVDTITYKVYAPKGNNTIELNYILPKKKDFDSLTSCKLLDETKIKMENKEYTILKYLYDEKYVYDEEYLIFYSPDFGVIMTKPEQWGNNQMQLFKTGDDKSDRIIFFLNETIKYKRDFFLNFKTEKTTEQ